jgi:hypothetical protein
MKRADAGSRLLCRGQRVELTRPATVHHRVVGPPPNIRTDLIDRIVCDSDEHEGRRVSDALRARSGGEPGNTGGQRASAFRIAAEHRHNRQADRVERLCECGADAARSDESNAWFG